jgi:hypothetical protein
MSKAPQAADRRTGRILMCAAAAAFAVPAVLAHYVDSKVADLESSLGDTLGSTVEIGGIEAGLTGSVRVHDIAVGGVFEADALEASVAPSSLLAGEIRADEIRIEHPRVSVHVDDRGHTNIERLIARTTERMRKQRPKPRAAAGDKSAAAAPAPAPAKPRRLRRIVVTDGDLIVDLGARGRVAVKGFELLPQENGMRVVVSSVATDLSVGAWDINGTFDRAAADVALPSMSLERVLATNGSFDVTADGSTYRIDDAVLARGVGGAEKLRLAATIDDGTSSPPLRVDFDRLDGRVRLEASLDDTPIALLSPLFPESVDLTYARATGSATVERSNGNFAVDVKGDVSGVVIDHRRLAAEPVPVDGHVDAQAALVEHEGRTFLDITKATFRHEQITVGVSAHAQLEGGLPSRGAVSVIMPRTSCVGAITSLPLPFRSSLAGFDASGTVAASLAVRFDMAEPEATALDVTVDVDDCKVLVEPNRSNAVALRSAWDHSFPDGSSGRVGPGQPDWVPLRRLPSHVINAFVAAEDGQFFKHPGFDLNQIERSLAIDLGQQKFVRGGSTISQQLVKNVFLDGRRNFARKLQEAVLTWRLEAHLDKREIIERYVNIVELGEGVFGIGPAAEHWFGKDPSRLGVREAAFLAAMTPAPQTISKRLRASGGVDARMMHRIQVVLRSMRLHRLLDDERYTRAKRSRLHLRSRALASRSVAPAVD